MSSSQSSRPRSRHWPAPMSPPFTSSSTHLPTSKQTFKLNHVKRLLFLAAAAHLCTSLPASHLSNPRRPNPEPRAEPICRRCGGWDDSWAAHNLRVTPLLRLRGKFPLCLSVRERQRAHFCPSANQQNLSDNYRELLERQREHAQLDTLFKGKQGTVAGVLF